MDNCLQGRFAMVKKISPLELSAIHTTELEIYKKNAQHIKDNKIEYHEYWWFLYGLNKMSELINKYGGFWPKTMEASDKQKTLELFYQSLYTNIDGFYDTISKIDIVTDIKTIHELEETIQIKIPLETAGSVRSSLLERVDAHTKNVKKTTNKEGGQDNEPLYKGKS